jgi:bis(5'-nucleosyl)-tetraphosphatase (symmetrical)
MATYIIGDIQGCYEGLQRLLSLVNFDPTKDRLVAVGDLIARGEDSLSTLRFLQSLGDSFQTVLGNHDLHFLAVSQGIKKAKQSDFLSPLLASPDCDNLVNWLRNFPLAYAINEHQTIVHAGLYPKWSVPQLLALSREVSAQLKGKTWKNLLKGMYGNAPEQWNNKLKGIKRYRFVINATTRMRFIGPHCSLDLNCKTAPEKAPKKLKPWFAVNNSKLSKDQQIIFGHWAALLGKTDSQQHIALDTGYVWGHSLTALRIEDNSFFTIKA